MAFRTPAPVHRVKDIPDGITLVLKAGERLRAAQAATLEAKAAEDLAMADFRELLRAGACGANCSGPTAEPEPARPHAYSAVDDVALAFHFRLAFYLIETPMLDYQTAADRIWGTGLERKVAKNRVSTHLARLRAAGIVTTQGSNRFVVDRERLAQLTGIGVTT